MLVRPLASPAPLEPPKTGDGQEVSPEVAGAACSLAFPGPCPGGAVGPQVEFLGCWLGGAHAAFPLAAIRVTCTGSCGVSNKANDAAWVAEEDYFNSSLSLADKGKSGSQFLTWSQVVTPGGTPWSGACLSSPFPRPASWILHWPIFSQGCGP